MLYFPQNSLKINAVGLPVCWMFILRHKGSENSSSYQKMIIKKTNLTADIFNTGIYQWIELQQVMHSLWMNPVTDFQIYNILLISEQPENTIFFFNKQFLILCNTLLQLLTLTSQLLCSYIYMIYLLCISVYLYISISSL